MVYVFLCLGSLRELPECKADKQKDYKTIANTIQTFAIIGMTQSYEREIMAKDTKERILKVATELFAKKGYAGTSIRDIAKCANVNLSMISYYLTIKRACIKRYSHSISTIQNPLYRHLRTQRIQKKHLNKY